MWTPFPALIPKTSLAISHTFSPSSVCRHKDPERTLNPSSKQREEPDPCMTVWTRISPPEANLLCLVTQVKKKHLCVTLHSLEGSC
jgi:hypothetical protein